MVTYDYFKKDIFPGCLPEESRFVPYFAGDHVKLISITTAFSIEGPSGTYAIRHYLQLIMTYGLGNRKYNTANLMYAVLQ